MCTCCGPRGYAIAVLLTYVTGLVFYLPHLVSIALSLHMVVMGFVTKRRSVVIGLAATELVFWIVCASLSWLMIPYWRYSPGYYNGYYYYSGYYYYGTDWYGGIFIAVWFLVALGCGIPRVILCWHFDNHHQEEMPLFYGAPPSYVSLPTSGSTYGSMRPAAPAFAYQPVPQGHGRVYGVPQGAVVYQPVMAPQQGVPGGAPFIVGPQVIGASQFMNAGAQQAAAAPASMPVFYGAANVSPMFEPPAVPVAQPMMQAVGPAAMQPAQPLVAPSPAGYVALPLEPAMDKQEQHHGVMTGPETSG